MVNRFGLWLLLSISACSSGGAASVPDDGDAADRPDSLSPITDGAAVDSGPWPGRSCAPTVESCPSKLCLNQRCVPRWEGLSVSKIDVASGANAWSVTTWADDVSAGPDTVVLLGQKLAPPDQTSSAM